LIIFGRVTTDTRESVSMDYDICPHCSTEPLTGHIPSVIITPLSNPYTS